MGKSFSSFGALPLISVADVADTARHPSDLQVKGDYLYVAEFYKTSGVNLGVGLLEVFDITDPTTPKLVHTVDVADPSRDIHFNGNVAYLAVDTQGIRVFDVGQPSTPTQVNTLLLGGDITKLVQEGNRIYAGNDSTGFHVIDAAEPSTLTLMATIDTPDQVWGLDVSNDIAYVADFDALRIYDVTIPTSPIVHGVVLNAAGWARDAAVSGTICYVANNFAGIDVFDVSDLDNPTLVGTYDTPGKSTRLRVDDGKLFNTDQTGGVQIFDISNPTTLSLLYSLSSGFDSISRAGNLDVAGDTIYVTADIGGFKVLRYPPENTIAPDRLDLADVNVQAFGEPTTGAVTIWNNGLGRLTVSSIDFNGPETASFGFTSDLTLPIIVPPQTSHSLTVRFSPISSLPAWWLNTTLNFMTDDPITPSLSVLLTGSAVPTDLSSFAID